MIAFGDARLPPRFWAKVRVDPATGCWIWTAYCDAGGYGRFGVSPAADRPRHTALAHRHAWLTLVGPIPEGLEPDHVCRVPACVRPELPHLELVTSVENTRRGNAGLVTGARHRAKTHCPAGHAYDEANTYRDRRGERHCRTCGREAVRRYRAGVGGSG